MFVIKLCYSIIFGKQELQGHFYLSENKILLIDIRKKKRDKFICFLCLIDQI